jgi:hypothetical protein
MKKLVFILLSLFLSGAIFGQQLSYRFANPRIIRLSGFDHLQFDVQILCDVADAYLWGATVKLNFNNTTIDNTVNNWVITKSGSFNALNGNGTAFKYNIVAKTITGIAPNKVCNIIIAGTPTALHLGPSDAEFFKIPSAGNWTTIITVSARLAVFTGDALAGIKFFESGMNGLATQQYITGPSAIANYNSTNIFDSHDFLDNYTGRFYSASKGWSQIGGTNDGSQHTNWAEKVSTTVWDGDAIIPNDGSESMAKALLIDNPATLTIPANGKMTVSGDTKIKTDYGLALLSDASGTGSLITGTSSGTGFAVAKRYMTTDAWHIVSSPLLGQTISGFLTSNSSVATSEDDAVRGMMDYNPELNDWNDYFSNASGGKLETSQGFCMRTNASSTVTFNGFLQTGFQQASGLTSEKWNCIGNPYTSAIGINTGSSSISRFLDENAANLDPSYGAIYIWDQPDANNGTAGMYSVISNASPAFVIQQSQAFLVKMNNGISSVGFTAGMQIHDPTLTLKSTKSVWPTIKLIATNSTQKSSTIISFNNRMTKGLDPTYDAGILKSSSDFTVYSRLIEDNGIPFAIQALPDDDYESMIIPIGIDLKVGGNVIFSAELISLSPDCMVILEDKQSKTFIDLSKNVYQTSIPANSGFSDRFKLHTSYLTTGLDLETLKGKLSAFAIRNVEMILKGDVSDMAVASLYDIMGRLILIKKLDAGNRNAIQLPMIKTGIYMLYVKDMGKVLGFKVPVKE